MATVTERSEKLKLTIEAYSKKLDQLRKMQAKIENQGKATEKKKDTRRKILVGSFMIGQMESKEETKTRMLAGLDGYLTRSDERALFGLAPLPVVVSAAPVQPEPVYPNSFSAAPVYSDTNDQLSPSRTASSYASS